jgi:cobalt-zinc-cadmium efflux system protein
VGHNHDHAHGPANYNATFAIGVGLNLVYVLVEVAAGLWFGSLALLADAGHNLSDIVGLLLAWGGHALSRVSRTKRYTYGFRSTSILAALFNGLILLVAIGAIAWESVRRFWDPVVVPGLMIIVVAFVGVIVNGITTWLFVQGREDDVNIRGAFLHMAADTGVSAVVVVGGIGIMLTGWTWIDPTLSLTVAVVILFGTWGLLREAVELVLQAVPRGIDPEEVERLLASQPGVTGVHDLHIWAMSTTEVAMTTHLVRPSLECNDAFLSETTALLKERFKIGHATIQIERDPHLMPHHGCDDQAHAHDHDHDHSHDRDHP